MMNDKKEDIQFRLYLIDQLLRLNQNIPEPIIKESISDEFGQYRKNYYEANKVRLKKMDRIRYYQKIGKPLPDKYRLDVQQVDETETVETVVKEKKLAKGYYFHKPSGKWQAQIVIEGEIIPLGYFKLEDDAKAAFEAAKLKYLK